MAQFSLQVLLDPHFCQLSEKLGVALIVRVENRSETTADDNRKRIKHIPPTYSPEHIPLDLISHYFLNSAEETSEHRRNVESQ